MSAKTKKLRPLLVFINPASGTKLAGKMFRTIVQPRLDECNLTYQAVETKYAGKVVDMDSTSQTNKPFSFAHYTV